MKKLLILSAIVLLLGGCISICEDHPAVRIYRSYQPQYIHHEVVPIRTPQYIGYRDRFGTLHLWPAQ